MPPSSEDISDRFVVVFFHTKAGELRCRATDVVARTTWIVEGASVLRQLLIEPPSSNGTEAGGIHRMTNTAEDEQS